MPPSNSGLLPIMRWDIYCVSCQWQETVQAPVPFVRLESGKDVEAQPQDYGRIAGFWEDYVCPEHFIITTRAMVVDEFGMDIESAYYHYVSGMGSTIPVPDCSICQRKMMGGQVLYDLPFYLGAQIELQNWVLQKTTELKRLVKIENHAIKKGEQTFDKSVQLLTAEVETITRFYDALCQQFGLKTPSLEIFGDVPDSIQEWDNSLAESLENAEYRLNQLNAREQQERQKSPAECPNCHKCTIYLLYATAV